MSTHHLRAKEQYGVFDAVTACSLNGLRAAKPMCLIAIVRLVVIAASVCAVEGTRRDVAAAKELPIVTLSREEILKAWAEGRPLHLPFTPDPAQLHEIDKYDPAAKVVAAYVDKIKQQNAPEAVDCREMKGPAASRLFPDYRFFVCQWNDKGTYTIDAIALDKDLKATTIGPFFRLDEDFGQFAARHKVRVTDEKDALLVWDAFCEIHRWRRVSNTVQRVSDRVWRLGAVPSDSHHNKAYFEMRLDDHAVVQSAKWTIEGDEADRAQKESLKYITEKEMTAIVEGSNKALSGEPLTREPSYSSAREKAQRFRGHWAFGAFKMRQDARFRLVPPKIQKVEDKSLANWIAALESRSDSNVEYAVDTQSMYQIQSPALEELFPKRTFLFVPYVIHPLSPPSPYDSGGLDFAFWGVLTISGTTVHAFSGDFINNPSFGYKATTDFASFVESEGIRVRSDKDAARFWDAYCSFHRVPWSSGKHIQVDNTSWRLNDNPTQPGEQFLEVRTDSDGKVLRMKLNKPDATTAREEKK